MMGHMTGNMVCDGSQSIWSRDREHIVCDESHEDCVTGGTCVSML